MKNKSQKFARAGYRIHFDRLKDVRSSVSAIRTHKFNCQIPQESEAELKKKFKEVSAVVDSSNRGSLLWFLIQLYGLGFLFVSKESKKNALLKKLYNQQTEELASSSEYSNHIKNQDVFLEFITKTPRSVFENIQNDFLPQSIIKSLGEIFGADKKISAENLSDYPIIKKAHDGLLEITKNKKRLNQDDLQEFFGIKIEAENTGGTTFIIQEIPFEELQENSAGEVDIYTAYFRHLSSAAQKTGFDIQSLAGVSENQNALSNLFNKSLKEFQKGFEESKRLVNFANPEYFEKNPSILEFIAKTVHQLASEIKPSSESDFIADNWGDYRNLIGGRLQGWLSNFQNRIAIFEKTLSENGSHQQVFDKIENGCDWKNIFPEVQKINLRKLKELRFDLAQSLDVLQGKSDAKVKNDFGSLLAEYEEYLRDFREFLMRWNNEGIPSEIDGNKINFFDKEKDKSASHFLNTKELCESNKKKGKSKDEDEEEEGELKEGRSRKWSKSGVPQELEKYPRFIGCSQKNPEEEIEKSRNELCPLISEAVKLAREIRDLNKTDFDFDGEKWSHSKGKKSDEFGLGLFHKNLETIKELAARYKNEKEIEKSKSFEFVQKFIDLENQKNDPKQIESWGKRNLSSVKLFVSGYERRNNQFLQTKSKNFSDYLNEFEVHFELQNKVSEQDFKNWLKISESGLAFDSNERGEILKIYLSLLLRNLPKEISLPQHLKDFTILQNTSLSSILFEDQKLKSSKIEAALVQRFFAASVGSKIRSNISLLSRKEYIERNVIQITNGAQSMLRYVALEWGNFDHLEVRKIAGKRIKLTKKRLAKLKAKAKTSFSNQALENLESAGIDAKKSNTEIVKEIWKKFGSWQPEAQRKLSQVLAEIPHKWEVVLKTKKPFNSLTAIQEGFFIEKSNDKNTFEFCSKRADYLYSFPIQTSVYQKQFLEKFLWGDKDGLLHQKIMGASVILEENKKINSKEKGDFAMYLAIPFSFKSEGENLPKGEEHHRKSTLEKQNILGIDLGEYGFGWAIFNPKTEKFLESGFMEIPLLPKMRAEANAWKDSQASGIFSRPTTHLADLREQAAGQIRNQIHNLAIKFGAKPIYEDSVDGFESGGQRVSKLYKTLKTADVISGGSNEADKAVRKHFWGGEYLKIGGVIGASKTSQTCRCCGVCKTSELEEEIKNSEKSTKDSLQQELERVQNAQRIEMPEEEKRKWKERGKKAWFKCQHCRNETDADEQAAKNIALKYFFMNSDSFKNDREELKNREEFKDRKSISLPLFLEKSIQFPDQKPNNKTTE